MPSADVSVVVTTCSDGPLLRACVGRLTESAVGTTDEPWAEVLVAWNVAAEDASDEALAALVELGARVLFEPRPGKAHALNRAVGEANGQIVAFTDDDALPDPDWLSAITAPLLDAESPWSGCGGQVLPVFPPGGPPPWYRHLLGRTDSTMLGPYHHLGPEALDYEDTPEGARLPFGACCAYRRDVLVERPYRPELGPNRVTGIAGGEDSELALRLLRSGHRLRYEPRARVEHPVSAERLTRAYVDRRYRALGRETVRLRRALGDAVPTASQLRSDLLRYRPRLWHDLRRGPERRLRRELRRLSLEGSLEEVLVP